MPPSLGAKGKPCHVGQCTWVSKKANVIKSRQFGHQRCVLIARQAELRGIAWQHTSGDPGGAERSGGAGRHGAKARERADDKGAFYTDRPDKRPVLLGQV